MTISFNPNDHKNLGELLCKVEDNEFYKEQRCGNMNEFLANLAVSASEEYECSAYESFKEMKEAMNKHRSNS